MRNGEIAIGVRELSVRYGSAPALADVDLDLPAHGVSAVMGPSGSGKSTFLAALNRLTDLLPGCRVDGRIWIGGQEVSGYDVDVRALRTRVGMIFQRPNPFFLSIRRNVELPLREHGLRRPEKLAERLEEALRDVGLWEEVKDRLDRDVPDKSLRVFRYHRATLARFLELLSAMGLAGPREITPSLVFCRVSDMQVKTLAELYDFLEPGQLLDGNSLPEAWRRDWDAA